MVPNRRTIRKKDVISVGKTDKKNPNILKMPKCPLPFKIGLLVSWKTAEIKKHFTHFDKNLLRKECKV